jgi:hypothetical protein
LANTKDRTITEQNQKIEDLMMAQAALEEEIERKRREVEEAVNTERANLEERMTALQAERDEARNQADSMVLESDKLTQKLMEVHEQYDDAQRRKQAAKDELQEPDPEDGEWNFVCEEKEYPVKIKKGVERQVTLNIQVWKQSNSEKTQFRAKEGADGAETCLNLTEDMLAELQADEDTYEFSRLGLSAAPDDPDRRIVLSALLKEKEEKLPPNETPVLCHIYKLDAYRYYISGVALTEGQLMSDIVISKDDVLTDKDLSSAIDSGVDGEELANLLLARVSFEEKEGIGFNFEKK